MTYLRTGLAYVLPGMLLSLILVDTAFAQLKNPLSDNYSSIPQFIAGALKVMVMVALCATEPPLPSTTL